MQYHHPKHRDLRERITVTLYVHCLSSSNLNFIIYNLIKKFKIILSVFVHVHSFMFFSLFIQLKNLLRVIKSCIFPGIPLPGTTVRSCVQGRAVIAGFKSWRLLAAVDTV
jgi:hypothetical protein